MHGHDTIRVLNAQRGPADGGQGHHHPLRNAEPSSMWYSRVLGALSRRTSRDPWPLLPVLSVFLLASRTGRFEGWFATFSLIEARSHPPFVRRSNFSVLSSTAMTLVALSLIATIGALRRPSEIPAPLLRPFRAHTADCQLPYRPRACRSPPLGTHPAGTRYPAET